ncbi:MAG: ParB/RepB/Spo0J family partition protein, partial [Sandaracinobacteroides sp.]
MAVRRGGLGRGLSALLEEMGSAPPSQEPDAKSASLLPLSMIDSNPNQPRRLFEEVALNELADSIRTKGILQPILVRPSGNGRYEIVAGERRWRASQLAGLHDIPVVVRSFSDADGFEAAIIENVQRTDLNPIEESQGYQRLIQDFGHTQEMVATVTG